MSLLQPQTETNHLARSTLSLQQSCPARDHVYPDVGHVPFTPSPSSFQSHSTSGSVRLMASQFILNRFDSATSGSGLQRVVTMSSAKNPHRLAKVEIGGLANNVHDINGAYKHHRSQPVLPSFLSRLNSTNDNEVHDLVCVGFGPASLAIAVALHDMEDPDLQEQLAIISPKVRFLERQSNFHWHAGMLLPGAKMQISFIKDLATLRDPSSHFTFLNYLKHHDRLVQFSNLDTFLPSRVEFEDYLKWSAEHFSHLVDYGHEVQRIKPARAVHGEKYDRLEVVSRDTATGELTTRLSKNVVIAVGGKASKPPMFPENHDRILHSSHYSTQISKVLPAKDKAYRIAVLGSGQSAVEVFNDLQTRYPNCATRLIFRDTALRPSDDSPFVNEVFNPDAVDDFYEQPDVLRDQLIRKNKATNYGVVRLELLEKVYEDQYMQSVQQPNKQLWQHQIMPEKEVVEVQDLPEQEAIRLELKGLDCLSKTEDLEVDAVVLATGYKRDAHLSMLEDCKDLNASKNGQWQTGRDYGLKLNRSLVTEDVGIWLQGCNEGTHGLADSLLSILATRSGELVGRIFGQGGTLSQR